MDDGYVGVDSGDIGWLDLAAYHHKRQLSTSIRILITTHKHWIIRAICVIVVGILMYWPRK